MVTKALNADPRGAAERFFASLTSLGKFDEIEVRGVMGGMFTPPSAKAVSSPFITEPSRTMNR